MSTDELEQNINTEEAVKEEDTTANEDFEEDSLEDDAQDVSFPEELENYLPTPENTDKIKKPLPVWLVACITAFATSLIMLMLFTFLILPNVKPSAVISYVNGGNGAEEAAELTGTAAIAEKVRPAIVSVSGTADYRSFFGISSQTFSGTGIVISENGYILTCYSLAGSGGDINVKAGDKSYTAKLVGQDPGKDIAILKIDAEGLPFITLEDSSTVHTGDNVIAIANVLGGNIGLSVTKGIICGINNGVSLSNGGSINLIQTDAITGVSGGCLLNEKGNVIGMLTASISSDSDKIGLAIPSSDIMSVAESLINTGLAPSGLVIGIRGSDGEHGITVDTVNDDSPAKKAGIKEGDLILKADGTAVKSVSEMNKIRDTHKKGDTIVLTVYRNGEIIEISVKL